ncbi:hypothetical protein QJS10_CPB19g00866 [Acorus calamus]|uniref:Endonuclease/exonuclease/phosphatase domain-containing protein n=1 Tax=Acorus calamus TaxID=4465 RepID=A0AAV9CJ19_ACOCL|nr:hypothetical protein QJS10_CPB19g00866 [Acorus calamus]
MEHRVQICCIQETKMAGIAQSIVREMGAGMLDGWACKDAIGASGGILTCWNSAFWKRVDISVGRFSLSVLLEDASSGFKWCCSGIYGPQEDGERLLLWEELSAIKARWNVPTALMGDFNIVRRAEERNHHGQTTPAMEIFFDWIEEEGLMDLPIPNHKFTWSNLRDLPSMARLDRVLINDEWEASFPGCHVRGLPRTVSDHIPLLLQAGEGGRKHDLGLDQPNTFEDGKMGGWCPLEFYKEEDGNIRNVPITNDRIKCVLPEEEWFADVSQETINKLSGRGKIINGERELNSPTASVSAQSMSSVRSHGSS